MTPSTDTARADAPAQEAVIDTNVVLDWLVFQDPSAQAMGQAVREGRLRWIGTAAMRAEMVDVLDRPAFAGWAPRRMGVEETFAMLCHPLPEPMTAAAGRLWCNDADDQVFIDLALQRGATWLFTRDKALLTLARRARTRGLRICTPASWPAACGQDSP